MEKRGLFLCVTEWASPCERATPVRSPKVCQIPPGEPCGWCLLEQFKAGWWGDVAVTDPWWAVTRTSAKDPPTNQMGAWEDNYKYSCQRRHIPIDALEWDQQPCKEMSGWDGRAGQTWEVGLQRAINERHVFVLLWAHCICWEGSIISRFNDKVSSQTVGEYFVWSRKEEISLWRWLQQLKVRAKADESQWICVWVCWFNMEGHWRSRAKLTEALSTDCWGTRLHQHHCI